MGKPPRTIYLKGKPYYRYDCYNTYAKTRKTANYFKKKNKSRYFIQPYDDGFLFPEKRYALYLNKVVGFT